MPWAAALAKPSANLASSPVSTKNDSRKLSGLWPKNGFLFPICLGFIATAPLLDIRNDFLGIDMRGPELGFGQICGAGLSEYPGSEYDDYDRASSGNTRSY
jgi:hypothetical protein